MNGSLRWWLVNAAADSPCLETQVESKSLKRSVIRRLPRLATIFIDKDPSIPNDVKWTQKSKTVIKHMEDYFSRKRPALQFFSDLSARPQE